VSAGCNGGPSTSKLGAPVQLVLGSATLGLILGELASQFTVVAPLFDGVVFYAATLCGQDPPPMPVWEASDALVIALGQESPFYAQTFAKMTALIANWAFDKLCDCTGPAPGPALVAPSPPPGSAITNPTPNQPCFQGNYAGEPPVNPNSSLLNDVDVTAPLLSTDGRIRTGDTHSNSGQIYGVPAGSTLVTWTGYNPPTASGAGANGQFGFAIWPFDVNMVAGSPIPFGPVDGTIAGTYTGMWEIPSWVSFWLLTVRQDDIPGIVAIEPPRMQTQVWCGGSVPGGQEACCPPDPSITFALNQIINQLQQLAKPQVKAYTKGNQHLALTGTGSITVAGLFGVQLQLTTGVPTQIQFPGVPPYERSVGWCSILTGDGMIDEVRITRENQVWASALAPYAITVGYQLNAGFTMSVTELLPA
jgi:hypothetical protein